MLPAPSNKSSWSIGSVFNRSNEKPPHPLQNYGSRQNETKSRPIQIVKLNNGHYHLDLPALETLIHSNRLSDFPISIISINGNTRSGKSFLMNNIIQQWEESESGMFSKYDGFTWRGGREAVTQGIWIWSNPFFTKDENHKVVAILLMDTQGLFDRQNDKRGNEVLFWISCMLSSTFIYNVKGELTLDKLEFLDSFASSAKTSAENTNLIFPKLLFAIRDWQCRKDNPFGMHKMTYTNKVVGKLIPSEKNFIHYLFMENKSVSEQNKRILESVLESFPSVEACLLPHPGYAIANDESTYVDLDFIDCAKELAKDLLESGGSVKKSVYGNHLTGLGLIRLGSMIEHILDTEPKTVSLTLKDLQNAYAFQLTCQEVRDKISKQLSELKTITELKRTYSQLKNFYIGTLTSVSAEERDTQKVQLTRCMNEVFDQHLQRQLDLLKNGAITKYNWDTLMIGFHEDAAKFTGDNQKMHFDKYISDIDKDTEVLKDYRLVRENMDDLMNTLKLSFSQHRIFRNISRLTINDMSLLIHKENGNMMAGEFQYNKDLNYNAYIGEKNLPDFNRTAFLKRYQKYTSDCIAQFNKETSAHPNEMLIEQYRAKLASYFNETCNVVSSAMGQLYGAIHKYNRGLLKINLVMLSVPDFDETVASLKADCIEQAKLSFENIRVYQASAFHFYKETLEIILNTFYECHLMRLIEILGQSLMDLFNQNMLALDISMYDQNILNQDEAKIRRMLIDKTKSLMYSEIVKHCVSKLELSLETCFKEHKAIQGTVILAIDAFDEIILQMTIARINGNVTSATTKEPIGHCTKLFKDQTKTLPNKSLVTKYFEKFDKYMSMRNSQSLTSLIDFLATRDNYNKSMSVSTNDELSSTLMKNQHELFRNQCTKIFEEISECIRNKELVQQFRVEFDTQLSNMHTKHLTNFVDALTKSTTADLKYEALKINIFDASEDEFNKKIKATEDKIFKKFIGKTVGIEAVGKLKTEVKKKLQSCVEENRKFYKGFQTAISSYVTELAKENFTTAAVSITSHENLHSNEIFKEFINQLPDKVSQANDRITQECKKSLKTDSEGDLELFDFYQNNMNSHLSNRIKKVEIMTEMQKQLLEQYYAEIEKMKEDEIKRVAFKEKHDQLRKAYREKFLLLSDEIKDDSLFQAQLNHFEKSMAWFFDTHNIRRNFKNVQNPFYRRIIRWFQGF